MDRYAPLMPESIRQCFERYIKNPRNVTTRERSALRDYIVTHGRLKVLNAVPASRSQHLDALMLED